MDFLVWSVLSVQYRYSWYSGLLWTENRLVKKNEVGGVPRLCGSAGSACTRQSVKYRLMCLRGSSGAT